MVSVIWNLSWLYYFFYEGFIPRWENEHIDQKVKILKDKMTAFPGVTHFIFRAFVSDLTCERFSYYYTVSKFPSGLEYYDSKWPIRKMKKFEFY